MAEVTFMLVILSLVSMWFNRNNFLNLILSLDMISLSLFILVSLVTVGYSFTELIIFMVLIVCEASLGLIVLILSMFFNKTDLLSVYSLC